MQIAEQNKRIPSYHPLISPKILFEEFSLDPNDKQLILATRKTITSIMKGTDNRLFVVVGPCSIHEPMAALEYALRLKKLANEIKNQLVLVMRVYFEKPRTISGWKGLIKTPDLDNNFNMNKGLSLARELLVRLAKLGVPTATEFLDTLTSQFIADTISWGVIGARTTQSQIHRELVSGLPMPVGFKNNTDGNVQIAIDAVQASKAPNCMLNVDTEGRAIVVHTQGNNATHIVLRGSDISPNYTPEKILEAVVKLQVHNLTPRLMVDCSHGNSQRDHKKQLDVVDVICEQIKAGDKHICGVMLESNLIEGKQTLQEGKSLNYGQSITDACLSWEQTEIALKKLARAVATRNRSV